MSVEIYVNRTMMLPLPDQSSARGFFSHTHSTGKDGGRVRTADRTIVY